MLTTKMRLIRAHAGNVFLLFMEVGGPPKRWNGGGGGDGAPGHKDPPLWGRGEWGS